MLSSTNARIWLYLGIADMRKQFDGLAALVKHQMQLPAHAGDWFVFVNRKRTMMKVLYYHQGGYCLWSKRLERGTFAKVAGNDGKLSLNAAQLQCLIDGIYWQKGKQNKRLK
ncbi:IS66 family insertion sequence element accessory protein TnpB [Ningiella sp. W23]|uniref:IS66 family insertion sequence element accessory protein TnpB n=1 Tax=Ningiella sp. W23 TaxID=3023715 RepID=UPI0037582D60